MKIGFIGLGNMATAMIGGILKQKIASPDQIYGSARTRKTETRLAEELKIVTTGDNRRTAVEVDVLFLAVKPQFFEEVIKELAGLDLLGKIVVSIAPGKSLAWLAECFGEKIPLARCMPNTPALVGEGCTTACFSPEVSAEQKDAVMTILESFGRAWEIPERLMDVAAGIGGCAPAWIFMLLEAMADGAVAEGMPRPLAYEIAAQTVQGSARMLLETGKHPGELKDMVCSPAGSTIQAVRLLESRGFRGNVIEAVIACIEKSRQL